jgi:glucose-6-phosphate isomerase
LKLQVRADWQELLGPTVSRLAEEAVASRIFDQDATIWGSDAEAEAAVRLGWTTAHLTAMTVLAAAEPIRTAWSATGVKRIVLCGMGGSSLAPEVMAMKFSLPVTILDATSPDQVAASFVNPAELAVIVSSKSGSTVETDSHRRLAIDTLTKAGLRPQDRMLIITDPDSPLDRWARDEGFAVMNADPFVGGRYSALTAFGLAPIFLAGGELTELINDAQKAVETLRLDSTENPALWLAALLANLTDSSETNTRRDKFLLSSRDLAGLPDWVEQLVAESTGKQGVGTLPIAVRSGDADLSHELADTIRIYLTEMFDSTLNAGQEDVRVVASLGSQFLLWEVATSVMGYLLGINPFDQPDVESAKRAAREVLARPKQAAAFSVVDRSCAIRALNLGAVNTLAQALDNLAEAVPTDGYLALLAFASRPEHPRLESLRSAFALRFARPVSFGWGPRYLHSTGQYHKGGPVQGAFLQIRIRSDFDLAVPGQSFSFGDLLQAQADGDAEVLAERGRPVLILEFEDANAALNALLDYCARTDS